RTQRGSDIKQKFDKKLLTDIFRITIFVPPSAKVAQLVEHILAKVRVASSNLVFRSKEVVSKKGATSFNFCIISNFFHRFIKYDFSYFSINAPELRINHGILREKMEK